TTRSLFKASIADQELDSGARTNRSEPTRIDALEVGKNVYQEAIRIAADSIRQSRRIMWKGGTALTGSEFLIIDSVRGVFRGSYGDGDARALEQAHMVVVRLH